MKRYLMLMHESAPSTGWDAYVAKLIAAKNLVGGSALDDGISAKKKVFATAKAKSITGYMVLEAKNLAAAKKIVLQNPAHLAGGTVDLFELVKS